MNFETNFCRSIGLTLLVAVMAACGAAGAASQSTPVMANVQTASTVAATPPTTTPRAVVAPTATPAAGRGVPSAAGDWQITIENVHEEASIRFALQTYTPKDGYAFLVVDTDLRKLNPTRSTGIMSSAGVIEESSGITHTASGGGIGAPMCVGCITFGVIAGSDEDSTTSFSFVFVLKKAELKKDWMFRFQDSLPVGFSLNDSATTRFKTEVRASPGALPDTCQLGALEPSGVTGRLTYWNLKDNRAMLGVKRVDGADMPDELICTGLAGGKAQAAADGAILLQTIPPQGWPSLSLIEPDGNVTSLVKNGLEIEAAFDATARYILFTTRAIDKSGETLFVYDRSTKKSKVLQSGASVTFWLLGNERAVVTMYPGSGDRKSWVMRTDGSDLKPLLLRKNVEPNHITADGDHVLYRDDHELVFTKLDGSDRKVIAEEGAKGCCISGVASSNNAFFLIDVPYTSTHKAEFYDLATAKRSTIISDVTDLQFHFSADNRWGVVLASVPTPDAKAANKKEKPEDKLASLVSTGDTTRVLRLIGISDGKTVRELPDVVNAWFSPDSTELAYTIRKGDDTFEMFVLSLPDGSSRSVGSGKVTGWWPLGRK